MHTGHSVGHPRTSEPGPSPDPGPLRLDVHKKSTYPVSGPSPPSPTSPPSPDFGGRKSVVEIVQVEIFPNFWGISGGLRRPRGSTQDVPRGRGRSLLAALAAPRRRPEISVGVRKFPWREKKFFFRRRARPRGSTQDVPRGGAAASSQLWPRRGAVWKFPWGFGNFRGGRKKNFSRNFPRRRAEGTGTAATRHAHFGPRTRTPCTAEIRQLRPKFT